MKLSTILIFAAVQLLSLVASTSNIQSPSLNLLKPSFLDFLTKREFITQTLPKNVEIRPSLQYLSIQQRVNNFNPLDNREFTNFYFMNDEHFQPGGPLIFFFYVAPMAFALGGQYFASFGPVFDFAAQLNGTIITPEHRYYENSFVTEDLSDENLKFLTVGQALADVAHLIMDLKRQERFRNSGKLRYFKKIQNLQKN
jgi:hypothetical protein